MQYLASGYANWFAKRHRCPGQLFQGRFRSQLVEDEGYALRELAAVFGLGHADSVCNLSRRVNGALAGSSKASTPYARSFSKPHGSDRRIVRRQIRSTGLRRLCFACPPTRTVNRIGRHG